MRAMTVPKISVPTPQTDRKYHMGMPLARGDGSPQCGTTGTPALVVPPGGGGQAASAWMDSGVVPVSVSATTVPPRTVRTVAMASSMPGMSGRATEGGEDRREVRVGLGLGRDLPVLGGHRVDLRDAGA